jgi:hypothetical protein
MGVTHKCAISLGWLLANRASAYISNLTTVITCCASVRATLCAIGILAVDEVAIVNFCGAPPRVA